MFEQEREQDISAASRIFSGVFQGVDRKIKIELEKIFLISFLKIYSGWIPRRTQYYHHPRDGSKDFLISMGYMNSFSGSLLGAIRDMVKIFTRSPKKSAELLGEALGMFFGFVAYGFVTRDGYYHFVSDTRLERESVKLECIKYFATTIKKFKYVETDYIKKRILQSQEKPQRTDEEKETLALIAAMF